MELAFSTDVAKKCEGRHKFFGFALERAA